MTGNKPNSTIRIVVVIALLAVTGFGIYYLINRSHKEGAIQSKERVKAIHEREVQKAIQELNAAKLAKKQAEERKALLKLRKTELQSLNAQMKRINAEKAAALAELDDIRRPHLFRSHAKKEAQIAEQLQVIENIDARAATMRNKLRKCNAAIDSLSVEATP